VTQGGYPGIGRATVGLARALLSSGTEHRLALLYRSDRPVPSRIVDTVRWPHHLLPVQAALRSAQDQCELPMRLRQYRVDLYHAPYFAIALKPGIPYAVTLHDTIPALYPHYWPAAAGAVIRAWQRRTVRNASVVITGAVAAQHDIQRLFAVDERQVAVTPWGPVEWDAVAEAPFKHLKEPYFLCVCTNKPHKNLARLVEAYCQALRHAIAVPAMVIAGGWDNRYPEAQSIAAKEPSAVDRIHFLHGPSDGTLRYLYQHAQAFIYPSLYEGFGLPVLEAMQAGLPIAASTTPAVAEVAGEAALLFDPLSVNAIADAIQTMALNGQMRARLRMAAVQRLQAFNWGDTARKTLNAYQLALGASAGNAPTADLGSRAL
jgi:glycosyltransferase involved in cell wall biosynthesis